MWRRMVCGWMAVVAPAMAARAAVSVQGTWWANEALPAAVARWVTDPPAAMDFATGDVRFDAEWRMGTWQMAALGYAGLIVAHPEARARWEGTLVRSVDLLLDPASRAFDTAAWGSDAFDHLDDPAPARAGLGYLALALGAERLVLPAGPHAAQHDRLCGSLLARVRAAAGRPLPTYPGEAYPVDEVMVLSALALWARSTEQPVDPAVAAGLARWEARSLTASGLVVQAVDPDTGAPRDAARGSGSALAAVALAWGDPARAARLGAAVRDQLGDAVLGFGVVREYPRGHGGAGDIDSGPLVGPWSISATGFGIGAARATGDRAWGRQLGATAWVWGLPTARGGYASGGALGTAILFAMAHTPMPTVAQ